MVADSFHATIASFTDGLTSYPKKIHSVSDVVERSRSGPNPRAAISKPALVHGLEITRCVRGNRSTSDACPSAQRVLGGVYEDLGRLDEAAAVLRGRQLSERIGNVEEAAGCLVNLALVELAHGEIDTTIQCNHRAIAELTPHRAPGTCCRERQSGRGLLARGDVDEVGEYCDRAITITTKNGDMLTVADAGFTSAIADLRSN